MKTDDPSPEERKHLRPLRMRGSIAAWSLAGTVICAAGLFLLTGLAGSVWLFLLYPLLIGGLIVSLGTLALHLLHRF